MKPIKTVVSLLLITVTVSAKAVPLLNGLAVEKQFNKDLYIAAVYSETLTDETAILLDSNAPRRLEVRIIASSLPARRFRNQWMEGIAINNHSDTLSSQSESMLTFANLFKGRFLRGDRLAIEFAADTSVTRIVLNGITLGEIGDPDFYNTLLLAWIGPVPPSTGFRDGLLSAGNVASSLLTTYEALEPSSERIAELQLRQISVEETLAAQTPVAEEILPKPTLEVADLPPPTLALAPNPTSTTPNPASATTSPATDNASVEPVEAAAVELVQGTPGTTETSAAYREEVVEDMEEEEAPLTADLILARQIYHSALLRHTFRHIRYPKRAQERGHEGSVRLNVVINTRGEVQEILAVQESRYSSLNREAVAAVERAGPYPSVPAQLGSDSFSFTVPITFDIPD
ncbi:TonB family protein [Microbulbifer sp. 2205BS26-8]|uniref:TonB family protein n=1 Tax=Microbulbifer sp. 2205BS26-8 TaxID=3064386 RepID=UPI00273E57C6|nr:TonB family protein [Microbulbifer sp. 2205BS26-8]MDP5209436.1 TonB family protein [Microbulbifer sp. 2205BS26-8]